MWRAFTSRFVGQFSASRALDQAAEQNRIERFFTFPNFEASAERCGEELRKAGLADVEVEEFPADGRTSWSGWRSMKAWDVESARLTMTAPRRELLSDWSQVPQCLAMYSGPFEQESELTEWDGEEGVDLSGKIPFTRRRINDVYPQMRAMGVRGIVSDFIGTLPGVRDASDLPDAVRWENAGLRPASGACWGFMLTPRQGQMLRDLLRRGPVRLRAEIRSRLYDGVFKSATGVIKGSERPEEEILFITHLYEPGANDNASGTGVGLELARSLNAAIEGGLIGRPRRSIRFLFGWEGYGLLAWLHAHSDLIPRLLGGLDIDEIGVDQSKGRSVLHLFMPPAANPSCVGDLLADICEGVLSPAIRWKAVADRAEIINDMVCCDPQMDIPVPCLIQYPSRNYHSSADTLDTLSAEVMERVAMVSATHLYFLASAGPAEAGWLGRLVSAGGRRRLGEVERELLAGSWPFGRERTLRWFTEQFSMSAASVERFGLSEAGVSALRDEMTRALGEWGSRLSARFPAEGVREAPGQHVQRAARLVLARTTLGSPKAWGSIDMSPEEEAEYRRVLYGSNLDMLFHRILYWADGKRTLLGIVERLEFELKTLLEDTSISRTSSGADIAVSGTPQLNLEAVLYVVDLLMRGGYLQE